jgi:hypothetical protein
MPRSSQTISVPAPIGGWNVRDPLPMMEAGFASILDNVFCLPSEIQVRKGYTRWATFTGIGETVFDYNTTAGGEILHVAVNNGGACSIYNISTTGAVGAAVVSGLTSARFKKAQITTSGGTFLYLVNGADAPVLYDGTTWRSITGVSSPYAITGVTTTYLKDVIVHKRRLWFVEKNSMNAWYLGTDSIAGAATKFDFGPIFKDGGYITKIDTWSIDAGTGLDDMMVVFTSNGEVAVYQGTDPATASTWSLQGVFYIGSPTGLGHTVKYGGDLLIINRDGIAQMSKSLMSSRVNTQLQITDKVQPQLASDSVSYNANYGWDILLFPPANMLLVNIPVSGSISYQYVMNTISGSWSRWTGLISMSWYTSGDSLYFGSNGYVGKAWNTQSDNGAEITADILPAYQNFGATSQLKRWSMARVILGSTAATAYGARMEVDFNLNPNAIPLTNTTSTIPATYGGAGSVYGSLIYVYGGSISILRRWNSISGMGYWGSPHIQVKTTYGDVRLYAIDLVMEAGGNI